MSELQRRRQRDLLLTTLIDLLVQILFFLLVAIAIVASRDNYQSIIKDARALMVETGRSLPDILKDWRRLVDPDSLKSKQLENERSQLLQKNRDLEGQLKAYEKRFRALGDKPCWLSDDLNPETLFLVRIFDDVIQVYQRWNTKREGGVPEFGVPLSSLERRLSPVEFVAAFRGVYDASKRANCRHYVDLEIHAQTGARATENRAIVEGYFYLRTVRWVSG